MTLSYHYGELDPFGRQGPHISATTTGTPTTGNWSQQVLSDEEFSILEHRSQSWLLGRFAILPVVAALPFRVVVVVVNFKDTISFYKWK